MRISIGDRTFFLGSRRHEMPPALTSALAAVEPNTAILERCAMALRDPGRTVPLARSGSEVAAPRDLPEILRIAASLPDTDPEAGSNGFLRARFSPRQYRRLIADGCIRVARVRDDILGFASIIPWRHEYLAVERASVDLKIGPVHLGFMNYSGEDFTRASLTGDIIYLAEVAMTPGTPHATPQLLRMLLRLYTEFPDSCFLSACGEIPKLNLRPALPYHRLGFTRIGCIRVPFRFVRSGPYPGRLSVVAPSQSGIWLKTPLRKANACSSD
ncbi:MAG: hypothetical protein EOM72_09720 [Opitutae bacterium]|nr:hypothetical protein [Opitutae bacterium]